MILLPLRCTLSEQLSYGLVTILERRLLCLPWPLPPPAQANSQGALRSQILPLIGHTSCDLRRRRDLTPLDNATVLLKDAHGSIIEHSLVALRSCITASYDFKGSYKGQDCMVHDKQISL